MGIIIISEIYFTKGILQKFQVSLEEIRQLQNDREEEKKLLDH
jgi:hypothetical protein